MPMASLSATMNLLLSHSSPHSVPPASNQARLHLGHSNQSPSFLRTHLVHTKTFTRTTMAVAVNVSRFQDMWPVSDPILRLSKAFKVDTHEMKLNLAVEANLTEHLQPYVLDVVKKASRKSDAGKGENKEYLPIEGLAAFKKVTAELLFGADNPPVIQQQKVATIQGLSGNGSLRLAAALIGQMFS